MRLEEVKILVQKYFEGETTLAEERRLSEFFTLEEVPEYLMPYREWFAGLKAEAGDPVFTAAGLQEMIMERERRQRGRVRSMRYTLMGIAASLLVAIGAMFWYQQQPDYRDTFDNPEKAMAVAGETLAFVSAKYNKGVEKLAALEKLSESVQPARKHLGTIEKGFEKADLFRYSPEP